MLQRLFLAAALAAGLSSAVHAQGVPSVIATCGVGVSLPLGPGGRLYQDQTGILCTTAGTGGGGGSTGSVTAAGTSGSVAQAVQGITGGVPQNAFVGQFNTTLPTLASGASAFVAVDNNGRQILAPSTTISVGNFPGTQAVTEANGANVVLGNTGDAANANTVLGQLRQSNVLLGAATPTGTNNIGRVGVDSVSVAGGLTTLSRIASAAASTNATSAKASGGRVYKITGLNAAASTRWLKFYNVAAAPKVGTTAVFFALPLPPGAFSFDAQDIGYTFGTGIAYAMTAGAADADTTALAAGDVLNLNVWYQ